MSWLMARLRAVAVAVGVALVSAALVSPACAQQFDELMKKLVSDSYDEKVDATEKLGALGDGCLLYTSDAADE